MEIFYKKRNDWQKVMEMSLERLKKGEVVQINIKSFSDYVGLKAAAEKFAVGAVKRRNIVLLKMGELEESMAGVVVKGPRERIEDWKEMTVSVLAEQLRKLRLELTRAHSIGDMPGMQKANEDACLIVVALHKKGVLPKEAINFKQDLNDKFSVISERIHSEWQDDMVVIEYFATSSMMYGFEKYLD